MALMALAKQSSLSFASGNNPSLISLLAILSLLIALMILDTCLSTYFS
jgi:hypothetical protein